MARNTKIENPVRVAIATVEDQNKYQMARNRNIDQTNQYFQTNVAADMPAPKSNDLLKLAQSLQEASPQIQQYVAKKEKEQQRADFASAEQEYLINPVKDSQDFIEKTKNKNDNIRKATAALYGNDLGIKDAQELEEKFRTAPNKDDPNFLTNLTSELVSRNKDIDDPYFKQAYNEPMLKKLESLKEIKFKQVQETDIENRKSKLYLDITNNKLGIDSIYENANLLGLEHKQTKEVIERALKDYVDNGDIEGHEKLSNQLLGYTDKKGFKPYADKSLELQKSGLIAMQNFSIKLDLKEKNEDAILTSELNDEIQQLVPKLLEEKNPSVIKSTINDFKEKYLKKGMSMEKWNHHENFLNSTYVKKEATEEQYTNEANIVIGLRSGQNVLGKNPVEKLNQLERDGTISSKGKFTIMENINAFVSQRYSEARSDQRQRESEARSYQRELQREERQRISFETNQLNSMNRELYSRSFSLIGVEDSTQQAFGLSKGTNPNKAVEQLLGTPSLQTIQNKYSNRIYELGNIKDPKERQNKFNQIMDDMQKDYTDTGLRLKTELPKLKSQIPTLEKAFIEMNTEIQLKKVKPSEWLRKKVDRGEYPESYFTLLPIFANNYNSWKTTNKFEQQTTEKQQQTTTTTNPNKRVISN